jgi:hypothetical protein
MAHEKSVETYDGTAYELDEMLYARHNEVTSMDDLLKQRGKPIPALFSLFYKFVQNPSSVSLETYKRMIDTDDTIGPGVDFLTSCLSSRLGRYQHPNPDITKWVNDRLDEVNGGWKNVVKEILSASWSGFCVAEKVWANTDNGFVVQKVVPLPPTTILFETERTGDLTPDGILQYQRNWNPVAMGYGIGYFGGMVTSGFGFVGGDAKPDPFARFGDLPFPMRTANSYNYLCIRIPTQKCVHYAFDASGKFGNPYGRALTLDTPVLTLDGWSTMGELDKGDMVFDEKGEICKVVAKSEVWKDRDVYRIHFSDGTHIDADENHQWPVTNLYERQLKKPATLRTSKEIFDAMNDETNSKNKCFGIEVPEPIQTPKRALLIPPYLLGQWLGDGHKNGGLITTHCDDAEEMCELFEECGYEVSEPILNGKDGNKGRIIRIYSGFQTQLRVMGLLNDKHIPEEYLLASEDQRLELLQGLMDSDGYITRGGYLDKTGYVYKGGNASFTNTNYNLVEGVAQLVRSLGMIATIAPKKRGWGTKWKLDAWEVRFTPFNIDVFKLERKKAKIQTTLSKKS